MAVVVVVVINIVIIINYYYYEKVTYYGKFPKMGRCINSYQEVLCSELKDVNH
jgi:hypothetical protein